MNISGPSSLVGIVDAVQAIGHEKGESPKTLVEKHKQGQGAEGQGGRRSRTARRGVSNGWASRFGLVRPDLCVCVFFFGGGGDFPNYVGFYFYFFPLSQPIEGPTGYMEHKKSSLESPPIYFLFQKGKGRKWGTWVHTFRHMTTRSEERFLQGCRDLLVSGMKSSLNIKFLSGISLASGTQTLGYPGQKRYASGLFLLF